MSKRLSKGILCLIVLLLLTSSFILPSFAVSDQSSPTSAPTPTPEILLPGICEAYVKVEFSTASKSILNCFMVTRPGSPQNFTLVNSDGSFYVPNYTNQLSRYIISQPGYLTRTVDLRIGMAANPIEMWAGDLNGDGSINIADIMIIAACFNTSSTDPLYKSLCDFNKDNSINITDIMIAVLHFAKGSADYPQFNPNIKY